MDSREEILKAVLLHQPESMSLPDISMFRGEHADHVQKYMDVFKSIGGDACLLEKMDALKGIITQRKENDNRFVTAISELNDVAELISPSADPHSFENIELAIIEARFAVAENGAVLVTEDLMGHRIIPYICQHLAVVVYAETIVPTLHEAYEIIGEGDYGFAGFIGGPSKTADIEQALVLGAHGPLSMTVYIIK